MRAAIPLSEFLKYYPTDDACLDEMFDGVYGDVNTYLFLTLILEKFLFSWSKNKIMHAVSEVAVDPNSRVVWQKGAHGSLLTKNGGYSVIKVEGVYDGQIIRVILKPGNNAEPIVTAFPLKSFSIP
jgi:hypothetical protein